MDIESQKLMQEQFTKLPVELQAALKSPKLHEQIRIIGQKYKLHIDQVGRLEDEVVMFMMGFSEPEEFISQLANQLKIEFAAAAGIASDIGKDIMIPIRDSMKSTDEQVSKSSSQSAPVVVKTTPPPPPAAQPKPAEVHPADLMLTQKTVTTAPVVSKPITPPPATAPVAPQPYKADPYREPAE